jgi:hypothetical protein
MEKLHPQTGPVTAEGKQISSRNATTHGGTSEKLVVAGERRQDFDTLLNDLLEEYAPATAQLRLLVEDAALARWFVWRKQRVYNAAEAALYAAQPAQELWTAEAYHQLALVDRYKTAAERALKRSLQNLDASRRLELREERHAVSYKRDEAKTRLAVAQVEDALEQREQVQWRAACNGFDCPTLVQNITVRVTRDGTLTDMRPSNDTMLRQLDRQSPFPPEDVYRKFVFPQGMPAEYYSFTDREDYRQEKGHIIEQSFSPGDWREIARREEELGTGHAVTRRKSTEEDFVS